MRLKYRPRPSDQSRRYAETVGDEREPEIDRPFDVGDQPEGVVYRRPGGSLVDVFGRCLVEVDEEGRELPRRPSRWQIDDVLRRR
jgi:hypothetical protein